MSSLHWVTKRAPTRLALSHSNDSKLRACHECTHHTRLKLLMVRVCGTSPLSPLAVSLCTRTSLENGISSRQQKENNGWMRTVGWGWASRPASFSLGCCVLCVILELTRNSSFCPGILTIFLLIPRVIFPFRCCSQASISPHF